MFSTLRYLPIAVVMALAFLVADPARAAAGWMGFRNDTASTLVIQETVGSRPGRPQKIFSNETVRDTPKSATGLRAFAIYPSGKPDKPLYTGRFPVPETGENVLYVIKSDGKGGLRIEVLKTPAATGILKRVSPKR
jgi:hypothetical protein